MHRVTQCKASPDYQLWLRFDDGIEGSVFLGNLLEIGAFSPWRDGENFCRAAGEAGGGTVGGGGGYRAGPGHSLPGPVFEQGQGIRIVGAGSGD